MPSYIDDLMARIEGGVLRGSVQLERQSLTALPDFTGVTVMGNFYVGHNQLTSLAGAPLKVMGNFDCSFNLLRSLAGAPREVGGWFACSDNRLPNLAGGPALVGDSYFCSHNPIKSLRGAPSSVGADFWCLGAQVELSRLNGSGNVLHYLPSVTGKLKIDGYSEADLAQARKGSERSAGGLAGLSDALNDHEIIQPNGVSRFNLPGCRAKRAEICLNYQGDMGPYLIVFYADPIPYHNEVSFKARFCPAVRHAGFDVDPDTVGIFSAPGGIDVRVPISDESAHRDERSAGGLCEALLLDHNGDRSPSALVESTQLNAREFDLPGHRAIWADLLCLGNHGCLRLEYTAAATASHVFLRQLLAMLKRTGWGAVDRAMVTTWIPAYAHDGESLRVNVDGVDTNLVRSVGGLGEPIRSLLR